jgi:hypothetical protein
LNSAREKIGKVKFLFLNRGRRRRRRRENRYLHDLVCGGMNEMKRKCSE